VQLLEQVVDVVLDRRDLDPEADRNLLYDRCSSRKPTISCSRPVRCSAVGWMSPSTASAATRRTSLPGHLRRHFQFPARGALDRGEQILECAVAADIACHARFELRDDVGLAIPTPSATSGTSGMSAFSSRVCDLDASGVNTRSGRSDRRPCDEARAL
jgi:hypothetical protein